MPGECFLILFFSRYTFIHRGIGGSLTPDPELKYFTQGQWITYTTQVKACHSN